MAIRIDLDCTDKFTPPPTRESRELGTHFKIGDVVAEVPPEMKGRNFSKQEVYTFFVESLPVLGVGLFTNFLYDLIKAGVVRVIKVNGKEVAPNPPAIEKALESVTNEPPAQG